jgi:hypothetical protein
MDLISHDEEMLGEEFNDIVEEEVRQEYFE